MLFGLVAYVFLVAAACVFLVAVEQEDRHVVGEFAAVQLPHLGDRGRQEILAGEPLRQLPVDHLDHAVLTQPLGAGRAHAPLDQPVRVQHQAPAATQLHLSAGPRGVPCPKGPGESAVRQQAQGRSAVLVREEVRGPSVPGDQWGGVARQAEPGAPAVGGDVDGAERREDLLALPLVLQDLLEGGEQLVAAEPGQGQGPPRDAQFHAERRLVGAVPADVADHHVDGAVGRTDRVVEVPAEQRAAAARSVVGREAQIGAFEQRCGEQAAFEAGVLLGAQGGLGEPPLGDVGALALDGVPDGAAEQPAVEFVAEEVVLGAHPYRRGGQLGVVLRGEGEDGVARGDPQDVLEGGEPVRLRRVPGGAGLAAGGQGEVQQDAVDVVREEPARLGQVAGGADPYPRSGRGREFGDGEGARRVVLDHQEGEVGAVGGLRSGVGALLRYGYGHRFGFPSLPRGRGGTTIDDPPDGDDSGPRWGNGMASRDRPPAYAQP